jgi:hypothetical protein
MKKSVTVVALAALILLGGATRIAAQDDVDETPTATGETPTAEAPLEATSTTVPVPTNTPASTTLDGHINAALIEDLNGDGAKDAGDAPPARSTLIELVPWSEVDSNGDPRVVLRLFTSPSGSFDFKDVPQGDYTLLIWWQAGFVTGGTPEIPDLLQAVFSIDKTGEVAAPTTTPDRFPGVMGSQQDANRGVRFVGTVPTEILLKKIDPNIVPFPVSSGDSLTPPVEGGALSVRQALGQLGSGWAPHTMAQENHSYRSDSLGISFQYPYGWTEGADTPPWTCPAGFTTDYVCPVTFGPASADPPIGVALNDAELSTGCPVSCYAGNGASGFLTQVTVRAGGWDAEQVEFDRNPPLPLMEAGTWPVYREVWTAVPGGRGLVFVMGFWPKGNAALEAEVRAGYQVILDSLQFITPSGGGKPETLPGTGIPADTPRNVWIAVAWVLGFLATGAVIIGAVLVVRKPSAGAGR